MNLLNIHFKIAYNYLHPLTIILVIPVHIKFSTSSSSTVGGSTDYVGIAPCYFFLLNHNKTRRLLQSN